MKRNILNFILVLGLLSSITMAQDVNSIFGGRLSLDAALSSKTKAVENMMKAMLGNMKVDLETKVYSFKGSFEDAVDGVNAPSDANVMGASEQILANSLSMFLMMTENLNPKPMGDDWYKKASAKISELGQQSGKSWVMRIGESAMENAADLRPGSTVNIRTITVSNPYFDLDNLKLVEGTWVTDVTASVKVTKEMLAEMSEGFEDDWEDEAMDMGIDLPQGARFVSIDDVADTEMMQGEVNYVVEKPVAEVIDFYKNYKKRYCTIEERSTMFNDNDEEITITYMVCLTHEGEVQAGDDVVHLTILSAPKGLLSDALGRNQGTWTLISINRWTEEDH